ncbi:MAG: hypothetical protein QM765_39095 [Myxococcales bacterium]
MPTKTVTYKRSQLYAEVWSEPVATVAKRYGVSGTALAKMCRSMGVPLPRCGYWAKKRAGNTMKQPPLPPRPEGTPEEVIARHEEWAQPKVSDQAQAARTAETQGSAKIVVPSEFVEPHKLVAQSARVLRRKNLQVMDGRVLRPLYEACLDIRVSRDQQDRALRLFDTLIKALEQRGLKSELTPPRKPTSPYERTPDSEPPSNATRVLVDGEWIYFGILERLRQVERVAPPGLKGRELEVWTRVRGGKDLVPKGVLQLEVHQQYLGVRVAWKDGRNKVEDCLNDFIAQLHVIAQALKDRRAAREKQAREWDERRKKEAADQARRFENQQRATRFEEELARWRLAPEYRAYIADVREVVSVAGCEIPEESEAREDPQVGRGLRG